MRRADTVELARLCAGSRCDLRGIPHRPFSIVPRRRCRSCGGVALGRLDTVPCRSCRAGALPHSAPTAGNPWCAHRPRTCASFGMTQPSPDISRGARELCERMRDADWPRGAEADQSKRPAALRPAAAGTACKPCRGTQSKARSRLRLIAARPSRALEAKAAFHGRACKRDRLRRREAVLRETPPPPAGAAQARVAPAVRIGSAARSATGVIDRDRTHANGGDLVKYPG